MTRYGKNVPRREKLIAMTQSGPSFAHIVHLPLSGQLVGIPNLVDAKNFTEDRGQLVKEDLRHVLEVAGHKKITF